MKHYLLLRDNKQSGPHTFEELLGMGLRTYDLIWVDGKSAAWRYPAEFPEFKDHAPAAPEQPFDRFYRKPATDQATLTPEPVLNSGVPANDLQPQQPADADEIPTLTRFMREQEEDRKKEADRIRFEFPERETPQASIPAQDDAAEEDRNRYVSVSLPAQDAERPIVVIGHVGAAPETPAPVAGSVASEPVGKPVSALFPERDPLAAPRRPAPRRSLPWLQYAAIFVGILSFLGLGILIGFKWSRERDGRQQDNATTLQSDRPAPTNTNALPVVQQPSVADSVASKAIQSESRAGRKQRKDSNANRPLVNGGIVHADLPEELDPAVLQEEARKRREAEDKEKVRGNITRMVGLQADKYKVGVFGGISDLDVTVNNGSGYALDQVVVEVDYLLSNKKVYKTETLRFIDLGPHGSKSLTLPRTSRGVKAESRIVRIDSHELDLAWSPQ